MAKGKKAANILQAQLKRRAQEVDVLRRVSETIASARYLEEILHLIVTMTAGMMGSKICSLMLWDEQRDELVIKATQSLSKDYINKPPIKVGQSVSGRVVQTKKPITVLDVTRSREFMYPEIARKEGIRSLLSVPMKIKGRVIGVINSYTSRQHRFTKDEISLLQAVANQAAVAIDNTNLLERSVALEDALATRKIVERAKGVLMQEQHISEAEAFRLIQRQAMNSRKSMRELAEAIILAKEVRGN